jgi:DUF971 family protein
MVSTNPLIIRRNDPTKLEIEWSDGHRTVYTAAQLRSICPCAHCVDEMTGRRVHDPKSVVDELTQQEVRMVGNYAISLHFSDGHHTGIYPFPMLRENDPDPAPAKQAEQDA